MKGYPQKSKILKDDAVDFRNILPWTVWHHNDIIQWRYLSVSSQQTMFFFSINHLICHLVPISTSQDTARFFTIFLLSLLNVFSLGNNISPWNHTVANSLQLQTDVCSRVHMEISTDIISLLFCCNSLNRLLVSHYQG